MYVFIELNAYTDPFGRSFNQKIIKTRSFRSLAAILSDKSTMQTNAQKFDVGHNYYRGVYATGCCEWIYFQ